MSRPPAVLCRSPLELDAARGALGGRPWVVRTGFSLPAEPWDLTDRRLCCVGSITSDDDRVAAIWAVVRGCAAVLAVADDFSDADAFVDDLARCAELVVFDDHARRPPPEAVADGTPDYAGLLDALAAGRSVDQAAATLFMSPRTAQRRLASARAALGTRTTREAVLAWSRLRER